MGSGGQDNNKNIMRKDRGNRKDMEYEDAPSGYVNLYNYKEPFMNFESGFGYQGVLLFDGASDKVQCHFCGKWFLHLSGHIGLHGLRVAEYKQEVGLSQTTALIGEKVRAKLIANGLEQRKKNLIVPKTVSEETKKKISESLKKNVVEIQNKRGTCPLQLLDRLRKKYAELGRMPMESEIQGYRTIEKVYGSMKNACEAAGILYRKPGETIMHTYTKEDAKEWIRAFVEVNERLPKLKDAKNQKKTSLFANIRSNKYGNFKELVNEAITEDGKYRKLNFFKYGKEELLKFLREFEKINGRKPAISDCKRGLLPSASRYYYHFGNWKNALANI